MSVVCKCRVCALEFALGSLIGGSGSFHLKGNVTSCSRCGGTADILDGTYTINNSQLVGLTGPTITLQVAQRLRLIAKQAQDGQIETHEIVAAIADISPELAKKLATTKITQIGFYIFILIMIVKAVTLDIKIDINRLFDQVIGLADPQGNYSPPHDLDDVILPQEVIINERSKPTMATIKDNGSPNRKERRRLAAHERRNTKYMA